MTVTAVVAARAGSVRLPGKAMLAFAGTTLIGHKVRTLRACPAVSRVVVNSDGPEIVAEAVRHGAEAIDGRDYAGDTHEMIADSCRKAGGDVILWAHPTNPLVRAVTYAAALAAYFDGLKHGADSLVSVTEIRRHAWVNGRPLNYDPWGKRHPLAAELKPIGFQDGAIFIQAREQAKASRYFFGRSPVLFPVAANEGVDIDDADDFRLATALWEADKPS